MADKKVSELDAIAGSATAADDLFLIVDASGSVTKKITRAELNNAIEQDVLSTVDINGGTIDSTVIGGTTPAAGDFTTLGATGNITVGGTVDGRDVAADGTKLDGIEASATADQTDAEIRAAVEAASDSNVFTDADHTKLNGIEASADVTDATNVAAAGALMTSGGTVTGDINFGDNDKAIFGAGSDLQITHTGSHSQIVDSGTGGLFIGGSSQIGLMNAALNEYMVNAVENGAVTLYHDNSAKIATSSNGVSVTGQVIATKGSTGTLATFTDGVATNFTFKTDGSSVGTFGTEAGSTQLAFMVANTEAARFDQNRNLLIGNSTFGAEDGVYISQGGNYVWARSDDTSGYFDRTGSDGKILEFRKAGSALGGIYAFSSEIALVSGNTGLYFDDANNKIFPLNGSGGVRDNITDLGASNARFQNGWFANVIYSHYLRGHNDTDTGIDIGNNGSTANTITFITGSSERARFSTGALRIGQTSTDVPGSGNTTTGIGLRTNGDAFFSDADSDAIYGNRNNAGGVVSIALSGTAKGGISVSSSAVSFNTTSDRRLKSNIEDATSASDKIDAIQVRQFDWNADDSHQDYGLIAQELQPIAPTAVLGDADSDDMMSVDYSKLVPMLIKEIQELRGRVAALEAN